MGDGTGERMGGGGRRRWLPTVLAAIAAAVALGLAFAPGGPGGPEAADAPPTPAGSAPTADASPEPIGTAELAALARREPGDPLAMGAVDAPVVMVTYADFQCPYCGRYARETAPALVQRFVDDGTLRIEWRDFPYLGEGSVTAALAARAAADQDAFWEFHDALFAATPSEDPAALTEAALVGVAEDLGLDVDRFTTAMRAPETAAAVQRDLAEGQAIGVTGTPAFLVNGHPVLGAHSTEVFTEVITAVAR